jgi:hypothetical protein
MHRLFGGKITDRDGLHAEIKHQGVSEFSMRRQFRCSVAAGARPDDLVDFSDPRIPTRLFACQFGCGHWRSLRSGTVRIVVAHWPECGLGQSVRLFGKHHISRSVSTALVLCIVLCCGIIENRGVEHSWLGTGGLWLGCEIFFQKPAKLPADGIVLISWKVIGEDRTWKRAVVVSGGAGDRRPDLAQV